MPSVIPGKPARPEGPRELRSEFDVCVVLVRPRYAENVGAVARALENVGAGELRLVLPNAITMEGIARRVARGGEPRLLAARYFDTLPEALDDVDLAVATSHKMGKRRRVLTPWALSGALLPVLKPRLIALVMGPEDHGLSREEIERCHRLVTIPSEGPLNLAQAVAVLLYELKVRPADFQVAPECGTESEAAAIPRIVRAAERALSRIGYPHHRKPVRHEMAKLADILSRARPNRWDMNFLIGMFRQVEHWADAREREESIHERLSLSTRDESIYEG